jgi:hypothetical protein
MSWSKSNASKDSAGVGFLCSSSLERALIGTPYNSLVVNAVASLTMKSQMVSISSWNVDISALDSLMFMSSCSSESP